MSALQPLFDYFNDNFALMKETLTDSAMVMVMSRLWKEVLATLESLLVPPLSDKPSQQKPLTQQELDIVFKWLQVCIFVQYLTILLCLLYPSSSSISSMQSMKKPESLLVFLWTFSSLPSITICKI